MSSEILDYQALCNRPDVISKSTLEDTLVEVRKHNSEVALRLNTILMGRPLLKPEAYEDGQYSDYYEIDITYQEKVAVVDCLKKSQENSDDGWLTSLLDTWNVMVE